MLGGYSDHTIDIYLLTDFGTSIDDMKSLEELIEMGEINQSKTADISISGGHTGTIQGYVYMGGEEKITDNAKTPMPNCDVYVSFKDGTETEHVKTNSEGFYKVEGLSRTDVDMTVLCIISPDSNLCDKLYFLSPESFDSCIDYEDDAYLEPSDFKIDVSEHVKRFHISAQVETTLFPEPVEMMSFYLPRIHLLMGDLAQESNKDPVPEFYLNENGDIVMQVDAPSEEEKEIKSIKLIIQGEFEAGYITDY